MIEFSGYNDLSVWLEGRTHEEIIAIAARAALRVLPLGAEILEGSHAGSEKNFALNIFRVNAYARACAFETVNEFEASGVAKYARVAARATMADARLSTKNTRVATSAAARAAAAARATEATDTATIIKAARAAAADITENSTGKPNIWKAISADANALENGMTAAQLAAAPLWPEEPPKWVLEHWEKLKSALHAAPEEDWDVWTDWYEARLRGDTPNEALERARVLEITEEMWEAGPKVVNAEIRRLIEKHRPTRVQLENAVSPQPVIKDGKLDVQPNDTYDVPDGSEELANLPIRQRAIIRALLAAISANRNISPAVLVALEEYDTELLARGTRPMLGLLNDMHQIVRDEYRILNKEKFFESEGGLRRSFLTFSANHRTITEHFPLDVQREALIRETHVNLTSLNPSELRERIDAVSTATHNAFADGAVSEDYRRVMERLTQDMLRVSETHLTEIDTDPDRSILDPPQVQWWKRRVISMRGFIGKSVTRLAEGAGILAFLETERGIALMMKLQELLDFFWSSE